MLKQLVRPSQLLLTFLLGLRLTFSKPQRGHLERTAESIIVCEGSKTLSALYRLWVEATDDSTVAHFFRDSPWIEDELSGALATFVMEDLLRRAESDGYAPVIFISIDDSVTHKDKHTSHLEAVDWAHDHAASRKGKQSYCKAAVHVSVRIQIGPWGYTFAWRIYLREKTVRRLNKQRKKEDRLKFRTKYHLARAMLAELKPFLPRGYAVYVLFDSWYASAKLIKFIRRQGWHVICALKSNRTLDDVQVNEWHQRFKGKRYTRVRVTVADKPKTYYVRSLSGKIKNFPDKVCLLISKQHPRSNKPKYFLCTDLSLSPQTVLAWYQKRWPIEVDYWYLKQELGLGDFRLQSYEAITKWYAVVHLVYTFLQWRLYNSWDTRSPLRSVADVIRRHQHEQARVLLESACQEVLDTGAIEPVLERYLIPESAF
jgi:hypothetical protein